MAAVLIQFSSLDNEFAQDFTKEEVESASYARDNNNDEMNEERGSGEVKLKKKIFTFCFRMDVLELGFINFGLKYRVAQNFIITFLIICILSFFFKFCNNIDLENAVFNGS